MGRVYNLRSARTKYAAVAQLVEHHVANVIVVGSNPISRSLLPHAIHGGGTPYLEPSQTAIPRLDRILYDAIPLTLFNTEVAGVAELSIAGVG